MAKGRHSGLGNPLINANQIVTEAQKRWLRTAEICGIIQNYKNFPLAAEPAKKPPSGSFFLFNRKELRCFRKDGYNWTKKRDGKTVMEAHEKLKVGGIKVLNCYYARGEENKNLQRRSYWLLQGFVSEGISNISTSGYQPVFFSWELSHVVLVHYREVKTSEGKWPLNQNVHAESEYGATSLFHEQDVNLDEQFNFQESCLLQTDNQEIHPMQNNLQVQLSDADHGCKTALEGKIDFAIINQWIMSDEVEYQVNHIKDADTSDIYSGKANEILLFRFEKLLSLTSACLPNADFISVSKKSQLSSKISSLLVGEDEEWDQMLNVIIYPKKEWDQMLTEKDFSSKELQDKLLKNLLKEKLHEWLLLKTAEDGKGPSVLDEGGQGVLHLAAALGYDWALKPTIIAGVSVNFRDVNGWTALHWAAFSGRERTVASLVSLGAAPGALIDPCSKYPLGRTAADLASANGHQGIAGYLAEFHLSSHLSSLMLDTGEGNAAGISGAKAVETVSERSATPVSDGDLPYSPKGSLAALCKASQSFARIHEDFRVKSFQKKRLKEYGDDKFGMPDERVLSLLALRTNKSGQHYLPVHAVAAIRIQNKFRCWKGRREFLIIKQRMVEIQAQARQHQVRKNYRKIIWSVGIVEKVILRWKRKGGGLRGFKAEALAEGRKMQDKSSEDDYDFLKEGRKQTEERLQKARATVKSMAQSAEARDQYDRLLNVLTDIQGSMVVG